MLLLMKDDIMFESLGTSHYEVILRRRMTMGKCETVSHCCNHHGSWICDILQVTIQTNWLRNFIPRLGVVNNIVRPLRIYCDNSVVDFFSKRISIPNVLNLWNWNILSLKKKFIDIRVSIEHVSTDLMIIDPLTKGLPLKVFTGHVKNMGIMRTSECCY